MEVLGYVLIGSGKQKLSIIGNNGDKTAYGVTKSSILVIKLNKYCGNEVDSSKNSYSKPTYYVTDLLNDKTHYMKIRPEKSRSALAIAPGFYIELGRNIDELIEIVKSTDSLYLINKINERGSKKLWGITRMSANGIPALLIGSIITINNRIVRFTPNSDLRKNKQYRQIESLTLLHTLSLKTDYRLDGCSSRYLQVITHLTRLLKWYVLGVVEKGNNNLDIKVRTEAGDYIYRFTLDKEEPSYLRLTDVTLDIVNK